MENLEFLLNKSARLLRLFEFNQNDETYKNYFNKHFHYIRSIGYFTCCNEVSSKQIEVYFRAIKNPVYRTEGVLVRVDNFR